MAPGNEGSKKRPSAAIGKAAGKKAKKDEERKALHKDLDYTPLSLEDVQLQLKKILKKIPIVPEDGFKISDDGGKSEQQSKETVPVPTKKCGYDKVALKNWAIAMQHVIEEVGYLMPNVSVATYRWGTNRSGAADQNLSLLLTEIARSQDQINGRVSPRLNDILCPVVTLLTDKTVTTKAEDGTEIKQNYFLHTYEDTEYVELCFASLGRNAGAIRHLMIANLDKILSALTDYLTADGKDKDSSRDFVY